MKIHYSVGPAFEALSKKPLGQTHIIPAPPHPLLIAYLLHYGGQKGPHLLISSQKNLLIEIQSALLFFELKQNIFFVEEKKWEPMSALKLSHKERAQKLKILVKAQNGSTADIFMAEPQTLLERLPSPQTIKYIPLKTGQKLATDFTAHLKKIGYENRDRVEQIGEFSMRGAVLDIFCPLNGPLRLDLIGYEVEQIRLFDVKTQAGLQELPSLKIAPAKADNSHNDSLSPFGFLDYMSSPLVWLLEEPTILKNTEQEWKANISQEYDFTKEQGVTFESQYLPNWKTKACREIAFTPYFSEEKVFQEKDKNLLLSFNTKHFFKKPNWPRQIKEQRNKGYLIFIFVLKEKVRSHIQSALEEVGMWVREEKSFFEMSLEQENNSHIVHLIQSVCLENLIWPEKNLIFLKADSGAGFPQAKPKPFFSENKQAGHFSFADIQVGSLMVHKQYGIGCFKGLKLLDFGAGENEFLILEYKDKEKLYVPVHSLHQVQKYMTSLKSDFQKLLDKLGGYRWHNTKEKVRQKIKNMSLELMNLYDLRARLKRKRFSPPSADFEKFEEEFPFVETPDQKKAIQDILKDLTEKDPPADRLICGDTGFGKTEVAMRAGFKVIEDGYQVALMAPTTLLSFQHFETFKNRFKNWPVSIRLLNRFTSLKERRKTLKEVREGKVDILIGTHRILSRDIYFKKPGLLIIDEEHLFGVRSKEKIKNWHAHIDTLSLSATPIPRSFSMSLSGLRDISLILTPPLNRKAVQTVISPFDEGLIKKAALKERVREGQIIFIHNRIASIYEMERKLKTLLPDLKIRVAHGKMKNSQENIVLDFFQKKFDLLLCTTIVESGMDFTQAGTLFIDRAEQFGLSELHQLRGRVGRSEREAYCYMLVEKRKKISDKAQERLRIIQENNQPGAGIAIAQYDLEMRGAGELMGKEQSGFLQEVGYALYFEFLKENLSSLKKEEQSLAPEPELRLNFPAFIPHSYIPHEKTRLIFYKKLATAHGLKELESIKKELEDFAGPLPEEAENLILLSHSRWLSKQYHIRELAYRPPFLYMSLSSTTPIPSAEILKWVEKGVCEWQDQETLKFSLPEENLSAVFYFLKNLYLIWT